MEIKTQQFTEEEVTDVDILFMGTTGELQMTLRSQDTMQLIPERETLIVERRSTTTPEDVTINMRNVLYVRERKRIIRTPIKNGIEGVAPSGGRDTSGVVA